MNHAECDVSVTADGVPVLFHDDNLARLGMFSSASQSLSQPQTETLSEAAQPKEAELQEQAVEQTETSAGTESDEIERTMVLSLNSKPKAAGFSLAGSNSKDSTGTGTGSVSPADGAAMHAQKRISSFIQNESKRPEQMTHAELSKLRTATGGSICTLEDLLENSAKPLQANANPNLKLVIELKISKVIAQMKGKGQLARARVAEAVFELFERKPHLLDLVSVVFSFDPLTIKTFAQLYHRSESL